MTADESRRLLIGEEVTYAGDQPISATVVRNSQSLIWLKYADGYEGRLRHDEMFLFARGRWTGKINKPA